MGRYESSKGGLKRGKGRHDSVVATAVDVKQDVRMNIFKV